MKSTNDKVVDLFRATRAGPDYSETGDNEYRSPAPHVEFKKSDDATLTIRLYEDYIQSQANWVSQAREDMEFYEGLQWDVRDQEELERRGQKAVVIPLIYQVVEQALSMLTANNPQFRVTAREDTDTKKAHVRSMLLQWIWEQSEKKGFRFKTSVKDFYVRGRGVLCVYVDPDADMGKGEVCIKDLDPEYVTVSPSSQSPLWEDAEHIIVHTFMSRGQIKQRYPHINVDILQQYKHGYTSASRHGRHNPNLMSMHVLDRQSQEDPIYEILERYSKVKRPYHRIIDPQDPFAEELLSEVQYKQRVLETGYIIATEDGTVKVAKDPIQVQQLDQLFIDLGGEITKDSDITVTFHYRMPPEQLDPNGQPVQQEPILTPGEPSTPDAIPGSQTWLTRSTIGRLITNQLLKSVDFLLTRVRVTGSVGYQDLYLGYDLPTEHYPIIPIMNNHNRTPYTNSDVRRVKDLQEVINKTLSLLLAHTANSTNTKLLIPDTSLTNLDTIEEKWSQAGTAVIPYTPDPSLGQNGGIHVVHPAPINQGLYGLIDSMKATIESVLGIYSLQQGDPANAPHTYRGTLAIDEYGSRRINSKKQDIYSSIGRAGKVALDLAMSVYNDSKVIRLLNPSGDSEVFQLQDFGMEAMDFTENPLSNIYDVIVVSGSTLPSNRWAYQQSYMEMYQMGIVDDEAVLKASEIPDAEAILKRKGMLQQALQGLQQMEQQMEQTMQEFQQLQAQMQEAQTQIELEKFKAGLAAVTERMQSLQTMQKRLLDIERQHQKQLLQMERRIAMSKQRASN